MKWILDEHQEILQTLVQKTKSKQSSHKTGCAKLIGDSKNQLNAKGFQGKVLKLEASVRAL